MSTQKTQCKARVTPPDSYWSRQCSRNAVRDGFCKQHHPESIKLMDEKSAKLFQDKIDNSIYTKYRKLEAENDELKEEIERLKKGETMCDHCDKPVDVMGNCCVIVDEFAYHLPCWEQVNNS